MSAAQKTIKGHSCGCPNTLLAAVSTSGVGKSSSNNCGRAHLYPPGTSAARAAGVTTDTDTGAGAGVGASPPSFGSPPPSTSVSGVGAARAHRAFPSSHIPQRPINTRATVCASTSPPRAPTGSTGAASRRCAKPASAIFSSAPATPLAPQRATARSSDRAAYCTVCSRGVGSTLRCPPLPQRRCPVSRAQAASEAREQTSSAASPQGEAATKGASHGSGASVFAAYMGPAWAMSANTSHTRGLSRALSEYTGVAVGSHSCLRGSCRVEANSALTPPEEEEEWGEIGPSVRSRSAIICTLSLLAKAITISEEDIKSSSVTDKAR
mmetsp:Transcript_12664/g.28410  ORF Transcript_12664/g.28410 Transcript_12664/m.28410 type:complete len:324 (-) Transcript_12664:144-1115(-)